MEIFDALSYDDVLLVPGYADFLPSEADISVQLFENVRLNAPVLSAAMDTVTEENMAIALALNGGAGVIHRNLTPEVQAKQIFAVKRFLNWVIDNPITVSDKMTVGDVRRIIQKEGVSGLPVVQDDGTLVGIITHRDIMFCNDNSEKVVDRMTKNVIVEEGDPSPESAVEKFHQYKIEKLPVVDSGRRLTGLITVKDMEKHQSYPNAATDKKGRLIVGAAISPMDWQKRMPLLTEAGVDFVALDAAHGDSRNVIEAVAAIKKRYDIPVIGGNVVTAEGTRRLCEAGADAVKVGVGPGSICTTRIVAGSGMPQFTAVLVCAEEAGKYNVPVIADGGIKFSGDIVKAIGAGASCVMLGNLLAGLKESPGKEVIYEGRMFKQYRGMGSIGAINEGSGDRYQMKDGDQPVPEGIEGNVPYKGELKDFLVQLTTGLKKGMGYCGCRTLDLLKNYRRFVKISGAGLQESHAHDVLITQEAPNYSRR